MVEQNSPVIFSEWLKLRRKALDLTQTELAQRVGCSVGALRKIESGDRRPSKQLAGLLAKALEIPNEDQQTFIRVARGELNIERLQQPAFGTLSTLPDLSDLLQSQLSTSLDSQPKPTLPSSRIPVPVTPLIGRDSEFAALERLFTDQQCRLLTLTGIGGIGKTRLALEFAVDKQTVFPGGVFYIPLAPVNSPEKIVPAIADVLDFGFSGPNEPKEQLFNYLASNIKLEALFILDNLEHLLVRSLAQDDTWGTAEFVSELLQRSPNVKILGTSRERLNLHGEWTYELHGLSVPPVEYAGRLEEYDSIALFINSARRIHADYQVSADELPSLVQICQMVEGIPLAIELAAAWVSILSSHEIAQEIQSNLDFLTSSMRDLPERHRSIRATFDHSWKLLSAEEREVLCQLSVFHGGFDRNAAYQIAGASLPLLASLSSKSLVRRSESGRYDLHEVIRQYALSHLNDHPRNLETYEWHCEYYLLWVGERENSLKSASQQEAIRQLTDEIDNIRAAWAWAIKYHKFDQLGKAGRSFGWYYEITGLYHEGIEQLELLVQALKAGQQNSQWDSVLGLALIHQALLYFRKGEFDCAQKLYRESIDILRPVGDHTLLADALIFLGIMLHLNGEYARAKSLMDEGLVFARERNEPWFEAFAIFNLGYISSLMGRYEEGYEGMLEGIAIWRKLGDPHAIALGLNYFVPTLCWLGHYAEAKAFMQESIALCESSKNRWGMGTAYRFLGLACLAEGQYTEAKTHLLKSLEIFGEDFIGWDIARARTYLGDASRLAGDFTEARQEYLEALRLAIEASATPIALDALLGLGYLQANAGKIERSIGLCYYIMDHPSSEEDTKSRAQKLCTSMESHLSPEQVKSARAIAQLRTFDSIVKEVQETA